MIFYVIYNSIGEPIDIFYPAAYDLDVSFDEYYDFYYRSVGYRWAKIVMDAFDYTVISVEKSDQ